MFAASVAALSRDPGRAHASGGQAAAGLPQLHADLLAATLASVAQARGHLPTELQADTSLAAPISQDLVAALEQPIAAGTVQVKGQQ